MRRTEAQQRNSSWYKHIPLMALLVASATAGGALSELREMRRSLAELQRIVSQLADQQLASVAQRVSALEQWKAGHEEMSRQIIKQHRLDEPLK